MHAPTALESVWPLFALRIRSEQLVLRLPLDHELPVLIDLAKAGIHPPDEMPFGVAWSTAPSPDFERGFVQHHWGGRASWDPGDWSLHLAVERGSRLIGSQSLVARGFAILRTVNTGSWLGQAYQRQGFGTEMRAAVLAFAFDRLGAVAAESDAFLDNPASSGVSRSLGYEENGRGTMAPQGVARDTQRFRMTAEIWRSRPRPPVTIEGFEACRELFGA